MDDTSAKIKGLIFRQMAEPDSVYGRKSGVIDALASGG